MKNISKKNQRKLLKKIQLSNHGKKLIHGQQDIEKLERTHERMEKYNRALLKIAHGGRFVTLAYFLGLRWV